MPAKSSEKFHITDLGHIWYMRVLGPAEDDSGLRFEIRCILKVKITYTRAKPGTLLVLVIIVIIMTMDLHYTICQKIKKKKKKKKKRNLNLDGHDSYTEDLG